ncbi:MAG: hypothetical protein IRY87_36860 [Acetobacteraceae bacterium]|uniref:hypothetical protein n=1 Tax=Roseomonadaceae TaxID=3385906 RepID=UPI001146097C|nr:MULTISPECIES: hypothetical protein [Acetobacteraceae]MBX6747636.1 hypothetical protein [Acetobacteraceae bacterium]
MNAKLNDEIADRTAEERSENEGMPEHAAKARDPVRWAADRHARASQLRSERPSGHIGISGIALMSCAALAALASARGAVRWMRHKGSALRLPR